MEIAHQSYFISDDPARLDLRAIHAALSDLYWSKGIPFEVVERAVRGSLCLGVYAADGSQVGLARFISDFATFCYVCDVYVLEEHRRHGLAEAVMKMAADHPQLQGLRRWTLVTKDAHGLYEKTGFKALANPSGHMEKLDPGIYSRAATAGQS